MEKEIHIQSPWLGQWCNICPRRTWWSARFWDRQGRRIQIPKIMGTHWQETVTPWFITCSTEQTLWKQKSLMSQTRPQIKLAPVSWALALFAAGFLTHAPETSESGGIGCLLLLSPHSLYFEKLTFLKFWKNQNTQFRIFYKGSGPRMIDLSFPTRCKPMYAAL